MPSRKVIFLSPRDFDLAAVSASSEIGSLPASNLQNQDPANVWRAEAAVDQYVDIAFQSIVQGSAAAMSGFNMTSTGVWRVEAYALAADIGISAAYDSGWQSIWPDGFKHADLDWGPETALLLFENEQAYRYWRIYFSDPSLTYIDVGRLALGAAVEFKINPRYDGGIGFVPIDIQEPNGYGQIFTDARPYQQRQFELVWSALGQQDVTQDAMALTRLHGQARDLFVFLNPADTALFHLKSMQALFEGQHKFVPQPTSVPDKDGASRLGWGFTLTLTQKL
jgi:hypothetical protein